MKEKIKNWLKNNWLNFIINFIGVYIILFVSFTILFELQRPDLLRLFTEEELKNYNISGVLALRAEQEWFLENYLPFQSFILTIGIYLFRFKRKN